MTRPLRARASGRIAAAIALALPVAAVTAVCLPMMPDCDFSISGKNGKFVDGVDPATLEAHDRVTTLATSAGKALSERAINRGDFAGVGLRMPRTSAAIEAVIERIRPKWRLRQPGPVKIFIIGEDRYSAAARPDGSIVISFGLIARAKTDDEFAWVLAHEFSHLALNHFGRTTDLILRKQALQRVVGAIEVGAAASRQRVDASGGRMRVYENSDPGSQRLAYAAWAHSRELETAFDLWDEGLSRGQEDQADAAGLDLAVLAGWSDGGYGNALATIELDELSRAERFKRFARQTGAYTESRGKIVIGKILAGGDIQSALKSGGSDWVANAGRIAINNAQSYAMQSHRPAAIRKKGLARYYRAAWKAPSPADDSNMVLTQLRATTEYQQAKIAVDAREAALAALENEDIPGAATQIVAARATSYANTPLIANVAAKISEAQGDLAAADQLYEIADGSGIGRPAPAPAASPPPKIRPGRRGARAVAILTTPPAALRAPPPDPLIAQSLTGYRDHVDLLIRRAAYARALDKVAQARARLGDDEAFLPALIKIYARTGKTDQMVGALDRCLDTEDEGLRHDCRYAAVGDEQMKRIEQMPPAEQAKVDRSLARKNDETRRKRWMDDVSGSAPSGG